MDELSKTTGFYKTDHIFTAFRKPNIRIKQIINKARKSGAAINLTSFKALNTLAGSEKHQGIILKRTEHHFFNESSIEEIAQERCGIYVLINRLNDPQNLGSIIRSMAAFGAKGLILNKKKTPPIGQVVWKVSSGAISHIPVLWVNGILNFLNQLDRMVAQKSYVLLGADLNGEALNGSSLKKIDLQNQKVFFLLGDEEKGISEHLMPRLDLKLKIPHSPRIDSLNVGVAAGIFLYYLTLDLS